MSTPRGPTIGLIGAGHWGMRLLAQLIALGATVACYPGSTSASRRRVQQAGVDLIAESVDELLANQAIDAVVIATPPATHAALTLRALDARKHTFVEKPLCLDMEDLTLVFERARATGRVLFTGYAVSYHPVVLELAGLAGTHWPTSIWSYRAKTGSFDSDIVSTHLVHELALADRVMSGINGWSILERSGAPSDPDAISLAIEATAGALIARVDRVAPVSRRELGVWTGKRVFRWDGGSDLLEYADGAFQAVFSDSTPALEMELRAFLSAIAVGALDPAAKAREQRLAELTVRVREAALT